MSSKVELVLYKHEQKDIYRDSKHAKLSDYFYPTLHSFCNFQTAQGLKGQLRTTLLFTEREGKITSEQVCTKTKHALKCSFHIGRESAATALKPFLLPKTSLNMQMKIGRDIMFSKSCQAGTARANDSWIFSYQHVMHKIKTCFIVCYVAYKCVVFQRQQIKDMAIVAKYGVVFFL